MNLILLGFPGSGKGTQAKAISGRLGLVHISTGDIFREEISRKSPLGLEVSGYISSGKLVPDLVVLKLVRSRIATETKGLIFDEFPRTVEQAQGLDDFFATREQRVDAVLFLHVEENEVVKRLAARRSCAKCGKIYNTITAPPARENVCDVCQGGLILRNDDMPEVIKQRLMVYKDLTEPLLAYYRGNGIFHEIKGDSSPDAITENALAVLKTWSK
jgi:adenylate kinase